MEEVHKYQVMYILSNRVVRIFPITKRVFFKYFKSVSVFMGTYVVPTKSLTKNPFSYTT